MPLDLDEVIERIDVCKLAGMNQAHEQIPNFGAVQRAIKQRIFTAQHRTYRLTNALCNITC